MVSVVLVVVVVVVRYRPDSTEHRSKPSNRRRATNNIRTVRSVGGWSWYRKSTRRNPPFRVLRWGFFVVSCVLLPRPPCEIPIEGKRSWNLGTYVFLILLMIVVLPPFLSRCLSDLLPSRRDTTGTSRRVSRRHKNSSLRKSVRGGETIQSRTTSIKCEE